MQRMLATLALAASLLVPATGGAQADAWTGYTYLASDKSIGAKNLIELAEEFSEKTGGEIDITVNLAGSLGIKAADITQAVGQGIVQIAADGFFLGTIEEGGILRLPMMFTTIEDFNKGLDVVTPYLEEAFAEKNVVLLGQYVYPLQVSWSTSDMTSLADMKGRQMRVSSAEQGAFVKAFGGSPVTLGGAEVPTALQTGVVDGVFTASVGGGILWKDQLKSTYRIGPNFFNSAIIVNKDAFEALSPEHQKILRELAAKYAKKATEEQMASEAKTTADLEAGGIAVHEASKEDINRAIELMAGTWDEWGQARSERTQKALAATREALGL